MTMKTTALRTVLLLALATSAAAASDATADAAAAEGGNSDGYRDPFDEIATDGTTRVQLHKPPESLLEVAEYLAPVLKYYVVLLGFFAVARYFSRMLEAEDSLKDAEQRRTRPNLRYDPMDDSDDSDADGTDSQQSKATPKATLTHRKAAAQVKTTGDVDDDVHEELITDGAKLIAIEKRATKKTAKKNHPLFEGLQKIEHELKQASESDGPNDVSWNDLHASMLLRYQQKYPDYGLRVQTNDDYDDEFKALLKKHDIDPDTIRHEVANARTAA